MREDPEEPIRGDEPSESNQLLERLQRLVRQGRETVEDLARKVLGRAAGSGAPDAEPEVARKSREPPPATSAPPASPADHDARARIEVARSRFASRGLEPFQGDLDPEVLTRVDSELTGLTFGYGDGRVVLLARDPRWLYVYWDIPEERRAPLRERGGSMALQLHDVTDIEFTGHNAWSVQRLSVGEEARSFYLPVPAMERHYLVEVGYGFADGSFSMLGRSAVASTPPAGPSSWVHDVFATLPPDEPLPRPEPGAGVSADGVAPGAQDDGVAAAPLSTAAGPAAVAMTPPRWTPGDPPGEAPGPWPPVAPGGGSAALSPSRDR